MREESSWAERVGDLGTSLALLFVSMGRTVTSLSQAVAEQSDEFLDSLAGQAESRLPPKPDPKAGTQSGETPPSV